MEFLMVSTPEDPKPGPPEPVKAPDRTPSRQPEPELPPKQPLRTPWRRVLLARRDPPTDPPDPHDPMPHEIDDPAAPGAPPEIIA